VEKNSKEWVDKLDAGVKSRMDGALEGAKKALRSGNPDEIAKALEELQQAYSAAGASLYAAGRGATGADAGGEGGPQASTGEPAGTRSDKDNVVDADYEIVDDEKNKKA
jgi:molecular chaperone DnaK